MPSLIYILFRRLRLPLIALVLVYSISILGFVLIPGMDDQGQPWSMSFFHAFYFVSFMGTTIGFGEIPYAFTDEQRFWALLSMYATVIAWLYCIGSLLSVFQDKVFRQQLQKNRFIKQMKRIREPFYIICGYGSTGVQLTRLLSNDNIQTVIVDIDEDRINELRAEDFLTTPRSLCADASESRVLELAGISSPWCQGVISLAREENINLTVAITAQLLNPSAKMIARVETPEAESNILSFGANEVINPFNIFGERLIELISSPALFCIQDWMTGERCRNIKEPPQIKPGKWIICGYRSFGRVLHQYLLDDGIECVIVMPEREQQHEIKIRGDIVYGRPTDTDTLKRAGIEEATGVIAATGNDANNLSVIMTAQELNPDIFKVARQNDEKNSHIFKKAMSGEWLHTVTDTEKPHEHKQIIDLLMQRDSVIANRIFALLRTPLLGDFLRIVGRFKHDKANELVSRILGVVDEDVPLLWELEVSRHSAPALSALIEKQTVLIGDLYRCNKQYAQNSIVLYMKQDNGNVLLPESTRQIKSGDRFLFCGTQDAKQKMSRLIHDYHMLENALSDDYIPSTWFWRWRQNIKH